MSETTSTTRLRYRIKGMLAMLPHAERLAIQSRILEKYGITRFTYSRYINLHTDDSVDIPAMMLTSFASELGATAEDLINQPLK